MPRTPRRPAGPERSLPFGSPHRPASPFRRRRQSQRCLFRPCQRRRCSRKQRRDAGYTKDHPQGLSRLTSWSKRLAPKPHRRKLFPFPGRHPSMRHSEKGNPAGHRPKVAGTYGQPGSRTPLQNTRRPAERRSRSRRSHNPGCHTRLWNRFPETHTFLEPGALESWECPMKEASRSNNPTLSGKGCRCEVATACDHPLNVGSEEAPHGAGLRPPLKRPVRFSRKPLSQRCRTRVQGRNQRDQAYKPVFDDKPALRQVSPPAVAPSLAAMRPNAPHDPAVKLKEEPADMGLAVVTGPNLE